MNPRIRTPQMVATALPVPPTLQNPRVEAYEVEWSHRDDGPRLVLVQRTVFLRGKTALVPEPPSYWYSTIVNRSDLCFTADAAVTHFINARLRSIERAQAGIERDRAAIEAARALVDDG